MQGFLVKADSGGPPVALGGLPPPCCGSGCVHFQSGARARQHDGQGFPPQPPPFRFDCRVKFGVHLIRKQRRGKEGGLRGGNLGRWFPPFLFRGLKYIAACKLGTTD